MRKDRWFWTIAPAAALLWGWVWPDPAYPLSPAKPPDQPSVAAVPETLISPSVAKRFYDVAYELRYDRTLNDAKAEQAMVFLQAAGQLDPASDVYSLLLDLACQYSRRDHLSQVTEWLVPAVQMSADLEALRGAVRYILDHIGSSQQKEQFLGTLLERIGGRNTILDSELMTLYGLLVLERSDQRAARSFFAKAYQIDKYNELAFAKLAELSPDQIGPALYLERLRLAMQETPLDLDTATAFAQYAEQLELYDLAAGSYGYCADLFTYLHPKQTLPPDIYLPWAISLYHTEDRRKVIQIATDLRNSGRVDIFLEAMAGKSAEKAGDSDLAGRILSGVEQLALQWVNQRSAGGTGDSSQVRPRQLAWFYCFVRPDTAQALDWANKAYTEEPNSMAAGALLAYALVMNDQSQWAKPLIEQWGGNQIAECALAQVRLTEPDKSKAIQTLRSAIAKDPGSLVAEQAKGLLVQQGLEYRPQADTEAILNTLTGGFGQTLVPRFVDPNKGVTFQVTLPANTFPYGSDIVGKVIVTNQGSDFLVIGDRGGMKGTVRVDGKVTGDLTRDLPGLISRQVLSDCRLAPGRSATASLRLMTGPLRDLLLTTPQASLKVEFTVYWDPQGTADGRVSSELAGVAPVTLTIARPRVELTAKGIRSQFNAMSIAEIPENIRTAELFVGLLREQQVMATQGVVYKFKFAEWMPALLKTSLTHDSGLLLYPGPEQWVVKVHTLADMIRFPLDLDLTKSVAQNLTDSHWPVRLMALYLLALDGEGGFGRVLEWTSKYDVHPLVRDMATVLMSGSDRPSAGTASKGAGPLGSMAQ